MKVSCAFVLLLFFQSVLSLSYMSALLKSIKSLGWKRTSLVATEAGLPVIPIEKKLSMINVASVWMQEMTCWNASFPSIIFLSDITTFNVEHFSAMIDCSEHYTLLFISTSPLSWETAKKIFSGLGKHHVFFMSLNMDSDNFLRVQTFRKSSSVVKHTLSSDGSSVDLALHYNLEQELIWNMNLDWVPFISLYDCDSLMKNCKAKGIMSDTFALLERLYNFTIVHDREPNNNWGTSGAENYSIAIFGALTDDIHYDLSMGPWSYNVDRSMHFDAPNAILVSSYRMVANLGLTPIDVTLFLRPFTLQSWGLCIIVTITVLGSIITMDKIGRTWSVRIVTISGWIFFLLVHAFYSGALTMFFSVSSVVPFQTIEDGVQNHPGWNLFTLHMNWYYLKVYRTKDGTYGGMSHMKDEFEEVPNLKAAVEKVVRDPGAFFVEDIWRFSYFMTTVPVAGSENVRTFGEYLEQKWHSLFPKNSPYTKMFRTGMEKLKQSGAIEQLKIKYFGSEESMKYLISDKHSLNGGHVALIFFVLSWSYLISLLLFIAECLYKKVNTN